MVEELIVTLTAERGRKFDETQEAIASYRASERARHASIVFMPRGTEPEKNYRVRLQAIREDASGRMMYRGAPASPEFSERWHDNGDGTIALATICTDWKLNESVFGERERRPKDRRTIKTTVVSNPRLVLGADMASSFVEDTPVQRLVDQEEAVESGAVVWRAVSNREEDLPRVQYPIREIEVTTESEWWQHRLDPTYRAVWKITATAVYDAGGTSTTAKIAIPCTTWMDLPGWCRRELEERFTLCSCARSRVDLLADAAVCTSCQSEASQIADIEAGLPPARRETFAGEARALLAGVCFSQAVGEEIASALATGDSREFAATEVKGYPFYYRTADGVFGSKFSPEALELFANLPAARGRGLVRLAAWLSDAHRRSEVEARDYYFRTQTAGAVIPFPTLSPDVLGRAILAVRVVDLVGFRRRQERAARRSEPVVVPDGPFRPIGSREFHCPSGHSVRLTKSEFRTYETGETVHISCSLCASSGLVRKERLLTETAGASDEELMAAKINQLRKKWLR